MSRAWSSYKIDREEDPLTAAFLSTLRLCPSFGERLLKNEIGKRLSLKDAEFRYLAQVHPLDEDFFAIADGMITFQHANTTIFIENKLGANLPPSQVDKYKKLARKHPGNLVWFIYRDEPTELRNKTYKRFRNTYWSDIHKCIHLMFESNRVHRPEKRVLSEFKEYLEAKDLDSFTGFKRNQIGAWSAAEDVKKQLRIYLNEFSKNETGIEGVLGNFSAKQAAAYEGEDIKLKISKRTRDFRWSKICDLSIGFFTGRSRYPSWVGTPFAYIYAGIRHEEWQRIKSRKENRSYRSAMRGLTRGGFEQEQVKRTPTWIGFIKKMSLSEIEGQRNQKEVLDDFFYKGLGVIEDHLFHEVERYRR